MTFSQDDKVTVIANPQCHGTVLDSDEANTLVRLDRLSFNMLFKTSKLKLREDK